MKEQRSWPGNSEYRWEGENVTVARGARVARLTRP